ncbi:hypothetical protein CgunFtcFv8_018158 [Champsocephalus gunnari]|uniref:Uncharacterized protein n=2 Tax=Champsocephalus gunnari TaxID=52237 RepID=A0AAN8DNN6_CHAGU|nr:hypothetical protein CgunFtcFv8_018158 [Champsocephalus gunnari]
MPPNRDRGRQGRGHSSHMAIFYGHAWTRPLLLTVASGSGSTSTKAVQSQATVENEEAAKSGSDSQEDVEPSTSAAPRKKRNRSLLQFLEAVRFNRQ